MDKNQPWEIACPYRYQPKDKKRENLKKVYQRLCILTQSCEDACFDVEWLCKEPSRKKDTTNFTVKKCEIEYCPLKITNNTDQQKRKDKRHERTKF